MTDKEKILAFLEGMSKGCCPKETKEIIINKIIPCINDLSEEPVSDEWIKELRTKLDSMSKEDFKKVFDKYAVDFKEEPVSEDLGDYINELSKQFSEVSFAKLSRIAVRVAKWQAEHLWKHADGNDLPIIDREVIALLYNGKVVFAHRPPEFWDGKDIVTGKVTRNYPKTYNKGGWNIPNVKWWLDCNMDSIFKRNNENSKINKR